MQVATHTLATEWCHHFGDSTIVCKCFKKNRCKTISSTNTTSREPHTSSEDLMILKSQDYIVSISDTPHTADCPNLLFFFRSGHPPSQLWMKLLWVLLQHTRCRTYHPQQTQGINSCVCGSSPCLMAANRLVSHAPRRPYCISHQPTNKVALLQSFPYWLMPIASFTLQLPVPLQ